MHVFHQAASLENKRIVGLFSGTVALRDSEITLHYVSRCYMMQLVGQSLKFKKAAILEELQFLLLARGNPELRDYFKFCNCGMVTR